MLHLRKLFSRSNLALFALGWIGKAVLLAVFLAGSTSIPQQSGESSEIPFTEEDEWLPEPYPAEQRARHLAALGIDRLHAAGTQGQGMKVVILDFGFRGYKNHLGKSLPKDVTVRSFRGDGNFEAKNSQHGILCAEVFHAFAPKAQLLLANWDPGAPEQFLDAIRWAKSEGAKIVSCSIIMPSWSDGDGGGVVNDGLAKIVGDGSNKDDMLCFVSAGNIARRHWCGDFNANTDGYHQWSKDVVVNKLTPWGNEKVSAELYWASDSEYELIVVNDATGAEVGRSACRRNRQCGAAVVRFPAERDVTYRIRVRLTKGEPGHFHLVALGANLSHVTAKGSIACPADCPAALAVGAVNSRGRRASYSSCGPNSKMPKPDFVAPVPFPSLWRDDPFTGTSAAAPQAAGLAALCWSKNPAKKADEIRDVMKKSAKDLCDPGHDYETGYGLINAPRE